MTEPITREALEEQNKALLQQVEQFERHFAAHANMDGIAREMREIAELPSERPSDVNPLIKVEMPDRGGILAYMVDIDLPYKGFPFAEFVEKIDTTKKINRAVLSSFFHSLKAKKWKLLLLPFFLNEISNAFLYSIHRVVVRFRVKPNMYCDAIRELNRALSVEDPNERVWQKDQRLMVRDVICMLLEFDNAYRFRFQDVIAELDKEALKKNPRKELVRLLRILQSREVTQEIKDTWTLVTLFLSFLLLINRRIKKDLVKVLTNLDLEKVKLSIEDKQFCVGRKDYRCKFLDNPTPEESRVMCRTRARLDREERRNAILKESNDAHVYVYQQVMNNQPTEEQVNKLKELDAKYETLLLELEKDYQTKLTVCQ